MDRRVKHIPGPSAAQTNPIPPAAHGVASRDPRIGFVSRDRRRMGRV